MATPARDFLFKFFRNGGSEAMNVDGTTPAHFDYVVPNNHTAHISRVCIHIVDAAMQQGTFGGISALTNGLLIRAYDANDNLLIDFLDGETIQSNADFLVLTGKDALLEPTAGDDLLPARWTISNAGDDLELKEGEYMRITVQDNLTTLTKFEAMVQGREIPDTLA